jgi:hypothetical protein
MNRRIYRSNAYIEPKPPELSSLDRLSERLVGHQNLFTNIATAVMIIVPGCLMVCGVVYLVFTIASFLW